MSSTASGDTPSDTEHNARMDELGKTIRGARERKRMSQEKLGELTGVSRSAVAQWESGNTVPESDRLAVIARALDIEGALMLGLPVTELPRNNHLSDTGPRQAFRHGDTPPRPLLIYRTAVAVKGRQDGFMLRAEKVGEVERPEFLRFSEKAFAAKVLDDRNAPAYRRRDLVLVDPDSPPIEDEDCLFTGDATASAGAFSLLGCLIRSTALVWIIRQYGVKGEREVAKAECPHAWPIVGRYNRR